MTDLDLVVDLDSGSRRRLSSVNRGLTTFETFASAGLPAPAAPAPRPQPQPARETAAVERKSLEDFEMLRVLGKGSYGKVVLVRKKDSGRLYALKVLSKPAVVRRKQVEHTKTERRVLASARHPFLVGLHYAWQTEAKLYLCTEFCPGGELFYHLCRHRRLPEAAVRVYAAEIVLALEQLHSMGVAYRDLKPENVLLDAEGHVKLADFGMAKEDVTSAVSGGTSLCGTPEYLAPEVLARQGHGNAVDWWGLGMLLHELLTGLPPWYCEDQQALFRRICSEPLQLPPTLSEDCAALLRGLLRRDPRRRLGSRGGAQELKDHAFFAGLDWAAALRRELEPPIRPQQAPAAEPGALPNFEDQFTRMPCESSGGGGVVASARDAAYALATQAVRFDGFTYDSSSPISGSSDSDGDDDPLSADMPPPPPPSSADIAELCRRLASASA